MSIPISRDGGVEPHLIKCSRCKGNNGLSIGVLMQAEYQGKMIYANVGKTSRTNRDLGENLKWTHVPIDQKEITMGICDECETELTIFQEELQKGGVFFKCLKCNKTGMIKGGAELAAIVRQEAGIATPNPCGIEFEECSQHSG